MDRRWPEKISTSKLQEGIQNICGKFEAWNLKCKHVLVWLIGGFDRNLPARFWDVSAWSTALPLVTYRAGAGYSSKNQLKPECVCLFPFLPLFKVQAFKLRIGDLDVTSLIFRGQMFLSLGAVVPSVLCSCLHHRKPPSDASCNFLKHRYCKQFNKCPLLSINA